jgi:hypothetical protein
VGGEGVPSVGGVADAELAIGGQIGAEPVGQVGGGPAVGVAGGVEVGGLCVEVEQAGARDGRVAGVGVRGCVVVVVADPVDPRGLAWRGWFVWVGWRGCVVGGRFGQAGEPVFVGGVVRIRESGELIELVDLVGVGFPARGGAGCAVGRRVCGGGAGVVAVFGEDGDTPDESGGQFAVA